MPTTRHGLYGGPARPYGSFAGKTVTALDTLCGQLYLAPELDGTVTLAGELRTTVRVNPELRGEVEAGFLRG